jgi:diguanylate cyclase (GGDEF)-like protein
MFPTHPYVGTVVVASSTVSAAAVATVALWPWLQPGVALLFFPAVILSAFVGGLAAGLTATALSTLVLAWPAAPESHSLGIALRVAVFVAIAVVASSLRGYRDEVRRKRREDREDLERRVAARTSELERANSALSAEIAQRADLERRLAYLVDHDFLTGLVNRRRFEEVLEEEISLSARHGHASALLLVDLDHFKDVNDAFGHQAGDQTLKTIGATLKTSVRQTDVVARLGGDEFGVLLRRVEPEHIGAMAEGIVKTIREQKVILGTRPVLVTASVGIAMLDGRSAAQVLAAADCAMYEAKRSGRNAVARHDHADTPHTMPSRLDELAWVRQALDEDRLRLFGQPIVDLKDGTVSQFELLLRVLDEHGDPLPPAEFLTMAERLGMITAVDAWVVREAVALVAQQAGGGRPLTFNVNISGRSVANSELVEVVDEALKKTGVDPSRLVFELTETAAIANIADAKSFAEQLRARGCQFALDDFGTGFGSFYYLKHIPFDYLKIDGDFIRGFASNAVDTLVVESIVRIARGLGKKTVAEFVGSLDIARQLQESGVDYAQGYQLGAPRPVRELLAAAT